MTLRRSLLLLLPAAMLLAGCSSSGISEGLYGQDAAIADESRTEKLLRRLPPPSRQPVVSVYDYKDLTGQHKPSDGIAQYSRAVTQGGAELLIKALMDAGGGNWFQVIERSGLENLLQERKIIRATRTEYADNGGQTLPGLPPLLYAGVLIEGGIVSYESNTLTGGVGARYLGIGGSTEYRRDVVTVSLRASSVSNGQVLVATTASKTIYSTALQGGVFKYIGLDELLEIESGFSVNEPPQFATRQAIELAVYSMIVEGAIKGIWSFEDEAAGKRVVQDYLNLKRGDSDVSDVLDERPYAAPPKPEKPDTEVPAAAPAPAAAAPLPPVAPAGNAPHPQSRSLARQPATVPAPAPAVPTLPTYIQVPGNVSHQNVPQPSLEQLPSTALPKATGKAPAYRARPSYYYQPGSNGTSRYRNDLRCDASGCYPVEP